MRKDALRYARRLSWPIFPIYEPIDDGTCSCGKEHGAKSIGKHPRTWRGVKSATINPDQIKKWWDLWPNASIGLSTDNGLVLDIDGADGERDLEKLQRKHGALPKTVEAITRKGRHLFFGVRKQMPNKTHVLGSMQIDSRGKGGYVLLAPSRHASGFVYAWRRSPFDVELAMAPRWVERTLRYNFKPDRKQDTSEQKLYRRSDATAGPPRDESRSGRDARRAFRAIRDGATDAEVRKLLRRTSSKAREEGNRYIDLVVTYARASWNAQVEQVRVVSAYVEHLPPNAFRQGAMSRIRIIASKNWKRIPLQVIVPSRDYGGAHIWGVWCAVVDGASPREIRKLPNFSDVSHLFNALELSRDRFGNVRWIRRA